MSYWFRFLLLRKLTILNAKCLRFSFSSICFSISPDVKTKGKTTRKSRSGSSSSSSSTSSSSSSSSSSSDSRSRSRSKRRRSRSGSSSSSSSASSAGEKKEKKAPPVKRKIYVARLSQNVTKESLRDIFSSYGKVCVDWLIEQEFDQLWITQKSCFDLFLSEVFLHSIVGLIDWFLISRLIDLLIDGSIFCGRSIDWLIWLFVWLIDWLIDFRWSPLTFPRTVPTPSCTGPSPTSNTTALRPVKKPSTAWTMAFWTEKWCRWRRWTTIWPVVDHRRHRVVARAIGIAIEAVGAVDCTVVVEGLDEVRRGVAADRRSGKTAAAPVRRAVADAVPSESGAIPAGIDAGARAILAAIDWMMLFRCFFFWLHWIIFRHLRCTIPAYFYLLPH